jgi:hypothetical protein
VIEVAAFASEVSKRIEERNMFYVAPFALIALVGLAASGVVPRRRRAVAAAGIVAGVLPVAIPYDRLITTTAVSDTFALLPWWWVNDHWLSLEQIRWGALAASVVAAAAFLLVPRRFALALTPLVAAYFVLTAAVVENGRHGIRQASLGKLWAGIRNTPPNWIDRAVGPHASVAILRTGATSDETVWENEFFNRSVRTVYHARVTRVPDPLPEQPLTPQTRVEYVLAADAAGTPVARDSAIGVTLYRVDGPLVIPTHITGLYPDDTWSGRQVTYRRTHCPGGRLTVTLGSDSSLFSRPQLVVAGPRRILVPPTGTTTVALPLVAGPHETCTIGFRIPHTKVPGHGDTRPLGVHFLAFDYTR